MGTGWDFGKMLDEAIKSSVFTHASAKDMPEPYDTMVDDVLAAIAKYRARYAPEKQPTDIVLSPFVWATLRHEEEMAGGPVNCPAYFTGLPVYIAYDREEMVGIMADLRAKGRRPMRVVSKDEAAAWFPKEKKE